MQAAAVAGAAPALSFCSRLSALSSRYPFHHRDPRPHRRPHLQNLRAQDRRHARAALRWLPAELRPTHPAHAPAIRHRLRATDLRRPSRQSALPRRRATTRPKRISPRRQRFPFRHTRRSRARRVGAIAVGATFAAVLFADVIPSAGVDHEPRNSNARRVPAACSARSIPDHQRGNRSSAIGLRKSGPSTAGGTCPSASCRNHSRFSIFAASTSNGA